jgi:hypothetical protein
VVFFFREEHVFIHSSTQTAVQHTHADTTWKDPDGGVPEKMHKAPWKKKNYKEALSGPAHTTVDRRSRPPPSPKRRQRGEKRRLPNAQLQEAPSQHLCFKSLKSGPSPAGHCHWGTSAGGHLVVPRNPAPVKRRRTTCHHQLNP